MALPFQIEICNLDRTKSSFLDQKKSNFHQKLNYKILSPMICFILVIAFSNINIKVSQLLKELDFI